MSIQLKPEQEHRIAKALRTGAYHSPDEVIDPALEVLHEHDEWLTVNGRRLTRRFVRALKNWNAARGFPNMSLTATSNGSKLSLNEAALCPRSRGTATS